MKDNLMKFIKDYKDRLANELYNQWQDLRVYKYLLAQKQVCLEVEDIILNNNETKICGKLEKYKKKLEKENDSAKINVINCIMEELAHN